MLIPTIGEGEGCFIQMDTSMREYGWVVKKHPDGGHYTIRKASRLEMYAACDQVATHIVKSYFEKNPANTR